MLSNVCRIPLSGKSSVRFRQRAILLRLAFDFTGGAAAMGGHQRAGTGDATTERSRCQDCHVAFSGLAPSQWLLEISGGEMKQGLRKRFWLKSVLAGAAGVLAIVTLIRRDWIELISGVDPDNHSGSLEWLIVIVFLTASVISTFFALVEWHRASAVTQ
jgi:hypothetical protein